MKLPTCTYSITVLGLTFGFSFYGLEFMMLFFVFYWILSLFDIITGVYISAKKGMLSSSKFGDGILKRANKSVIMLFLAIAVAHIRFTLLNGAECESVQCISLSLIPSVIVGFFLIEEVISIIENSIKISDNDNKVLRILEKFFCVTFDKGVAFTKKKIDCIEKE